MAAVVDMMLVRGGSSFLTSRGSRGVRVANCGRVSSQNYKMERMFTYELDELDRHPVVSSIHKKLKQPGRQGQEVVGPPPSQLANNVDDGGRDAWVLVGVHQALLDLGPCCAQRLGVHQGQAVQSDERLLADVGVAVAQAREQVGERREGERWGDDVRESRDGQGDDGRGGGAEVLYKTWSAGAWGFEVQP